MTPAEQLIGLTSLSGQHTAAEHFLSITQGTGTGAFIASEMTVDIMEIKVEVQAPIEVEIVEPIEVEVQQTINVELC